MKYGKNKVILVGNLGKDPELKYSSGGVAICTFSLAVTEKWKKEDHTEWFNIVMFKKLAEVAAEYLSKGSAVYLEGKLQTESWEADGIKRYMTKVIASEMIMLGTEKKEKNNSTNKDTVPDDDIPF